jgi:thiol:disulfide interchange protein DsbA
MLLKVLKICACILWLASLVVCPNAIADENQNFQLGREYVELKQHLAERGDKRIEVIEFFWYGCRHCYTVKTQLEAWAAKLPPDVNFLLMPASFNPQVEFHARIFLALEALGSGPELHSKVFRIFQDEGRFINDLETLPGLAKDLKLDPKTFVEAFNSPAVEARLKTVNELMTAYDLPGVPAMVVAGKYRFDIGTANGPSGMIKLADYLIERERRTKGGQN